LRLLFFLVLQVLPASGLALMLFTIVEMEAGLFGCSLDRALSTAILISFVSAIAFIVSVSTLFEFNDDHSAGNSLVTLVPFLFLATGLCSLWLPLWVKLV
jgi:hypothetical protein